MWGVGYRVWGVGCRVWGVGCRVWGVGVRSRVGTSRGRGKGMGRGGLLPMTSHSIIYSRVGQIAIFSHCQP